MYKSLLEGHSFVRWLVLITLLYAIVRAFKGYQSRAPFTKRDNAVRHWTATFAHIQLMIGLVLYFQSPVAKSLWTHFNAASQNFELAFFGIIHELLMLTAIVFITIGSAMAKRQSTDHQKFRTMLVWFSIALLIILISIPWPFSPLANRPYIR